MKRLHFALTALLSLAGCSGSNGGGGQTSRENGYLSCAATSGCDGVLCTADDGSTTCEPLPASCGAEVDCACAGAALCGERDCRPEANGIACVEPQPDDAAAPSPDLGTDALHPLPDMSSQDASAADGAVNAPDTPNASADLRVEPNDAGATDGGVEAGVDLGAAPDALAILDGAAAADTDGDGVSDLRDYCPGAANPLQRDADLDTLGDACDVGDTDRDGTADRDDLRRRRSGRRLRDSERRRRRRRAGRPRQLSPPTQRGSGGRGHGRRGRRL